MENSILTNEIKAFSFTRYLLKSICSLKLCSFVINVSVENLLAGVRQSSEGLLYDTG